MTLLTISSIPTGSRPGLLSKATPRFASAPSPSGSTYYVANLIAILLTALHNEADDFLKPEAILCRSVSSCLKKPELSCVLNMLFLIELLSSLS